MQLVERPFVVAVTLAAACQPRASPPVTYDVGVDAPTQGVAPARPEAPVDAGRDDAVALDAAAPVHPPHAFQPRVRPRPPFDRVFVDVSNVALLETRPTDYVFDGDVAEWRALPVSTLPADSGRARIAAALTATGFLVAGEVVAHGGEHRLDHVRIVVGFPQAVLPPVAFMSHLDGAVVTEAWCKNEVSHTMGFESEHPDGPREAVASCLVWLSRCRELRGRIEDRFERTFDVDLAAAKVSGAPGARVLVHRSDASNGASFELEVPLASMPETSEMPLVTMRVAARLFSAASRGMPSNADLAWSVSGRKDPLRLHGIPALVERIVAEAEASSAQGDGSIAVGASYVPAPATRLVSFYFNVGMAGQWLPYAEQLSPEVADVDVARGRTLFTLPAADGGPPGDIAITAHAAFFDDTFGKRHPKVSLVSHRGGEVLDVSASTSFDPYTLVAREPGVHILDVYQGPAGPYGSGPSGAMTGYRFEVITMDEGGRFAPPRAFDLAIWRGYVMGTDKVPGFEGQIGISDPRLSISPTLTDFGLLGTFVTEPPTRADAGNVTGWPGGSDDSPLVEHSFRVGYRWDAEKKDYLLSASARVTPRLDGGR